MSNSLSFVSQSYLASLHLRASSVWQTLPEAERSIFSSIEDFIFVFIRCEIHKLAVDQGLMK